jgi:hypothetical protein
MATQNVYLLNVIFDHAIERFQFTVSTTGTGTVTAYVADDAALAERITNSRTDGRLNAGYYLLTFGEDLFITDYRELTAAEVLGAVNAAHRRTHGIARETLA